jgi:outer membrane protein with beta-barrel domain
MEVVKQMNLRLFVCLALFSVVVVPASLFSQAAEISPYAGYQWVGNFGGDIGEFKGGQILGVRGGGFVTPHFEIGGNYSFNNHFQPRRSNENASLAGALGFPQGAVRAHLWEAEFSYNFAKRNMFGSTVKPYATVGFGGITTRIKDADSFTLNVRSVTVQDSQTVSPSGLVKENWAPQTLFFANDVLENNNTFFTFSYGGGLKAMRLWGPLGFFGDFRGRTVPNFVGGRANTWPELSAGLNFAWGER